MNPTQTKMARAALGWSAATLAKQAGIGSATLARFELGQPVASATVDAIRSAFERAGVVLIDGGKYSGGVVPPS